MNDLSLSAFFLDLQTTGANPSSGRILEIAWSGLQSEKIESEMLGSESVTSVSRRILKVAGISEVELGLASPEEVVVERFRKFLNERERGPAIIHYAKFEQPFLNEWLPNDFPKFDVICTFEIARRLLPNLPTRGIRGLAGFFGEPTSEFKRARSQVSATRVIWQGLAQMLAERGIRTLSELRDFLAEPVPKKTHHAYRLSKETRLALTHSPGIYRMLGKTGEVLYVGKATSLRDRVNSYFRGKKGREARKLEMMTQVWGIETVCCKSPLEAALLETDEIERLNPPYNINLKSGDRKIFFYSRDFSSCLDREDARHTVGPFRNESVLSELFSIVEKIENKKDFAEDFFHEVISPALLEEGFSLFLERNSFSQSHFLTRRQALTVCLRLHRRAVPPKNLQEEVSSSSLSGKFHRHLIRTAKSYLRAKALTRLLNSEVRVENQEGDLVTLFFRRGQLQERSLVGDAASHEKGWLGLEVDTYDRMTVLNSELKR